MDTRIDEQTVTTTDGQAIAARFFSPADDPRASVLIAPAMGVPQTYYEPLARWLAGNGFLAASFDYRGVGLSRPERLRGFPASLMDWARYDADAMITELGDRAAGAPLYWVGHSVGGQIPPFVPGHDRLSRIVTIACGSGYWRENSPPLKRRVWLVWYGIVPLITPLVGYFPGKRLNIVGDLPRGVVEQWRRWCLHSEYAVGVEPGARERYAAVRTPIVSLSFTDDEFMSARNTESIHGFYINAPRTMVRITPEEAGVRQIGHFGFFRPEQEEPLWNRYLMPALAADLPG